VQSTAPAAVSYTPPVPALFALASRSSPGLSCAPLRSRSPRPAAHQSRTNTCPGV